MDYNAECTQSNFDMKRFFLTLLLLLTACVQPTAAPGLETATPVPSPTETPMPVTPTSAPGSTAMPEPSVTLQRGINLGNMLEAPNEGEWGLFVEEEYFDLIQEAGFDFVRLPVKWFAHTKDVGHNDGDAGHEIIPEFFTRVDEVVGWALKRDLKIIIDFHHYDELMANPNLDQFLFMWEQIAEHYQDSPSEVIFELLNEPHDKMDAALWNTYIDYGLMVIRESNPTRDVIVGPVNWNAYDSLPALEIPQDEHLIVTFHYYLPFQFTHQGAEWVEGSDPWLGTTWDATDSEKAEISAHFDSVAEWAERHNNIRILLGEFGAYSKADMASRIRWTEFVAREAERHGFAWAYWEFASGFGIYDPEAGVWREELLRALIP
jgi:endoglucanase